MRLRFIAPLPKQKVYVALSGGVDSLSLAYFLSKTREVTCLHFDHQTPSASMFKKHCIDFCNKNGLELIEGTLTREKEKIESWEEFWRLQRYDFLNKFEGPVLTGHNLDDQVETWIWSCLHGNPRLMPYKNKNILRPLIGCEKKDIVQYARNQGIVWIEDPSNEDESYTRNFIRKNLVPNALKVNPGLYKVIYKKMLKEGYIQND